MDGPLHSYSKYYFYPEVIRSKVIEHAQTLTWKEKSGQDCYQCQKNLRMFINSTLTQFSKKRNKA